MRCRIHGLAIVIVIAGAGGWGQGGPLTYRGMPHLPSGAATLTPCPDCLVVGNIGSSGKDGVRIEPGNGAEDLEVTFDMGPSGALPPGSALVVAADSGAGSAPLLVTISETGGGLGSLAADFSFFNPPGVRLELLLDGVIVHVAELTPPFPATLLTGSLGTVGDDGFMSIDGGYANPAGANQGPYLKIKMSRVIVTSVSTSSAGALVANEIRVTMTGLPTGFTKPLIDAVELTAANLGQFTLHDERLVKFGNPHRALGQATLAAATDNLLLDSLGTTGGDGVESDPDRLGRVAVQFPSIPVSEEVALNFSKIGYEQGSNAEHSAATMLDGATGGAAMTLDTDFADYSAISRFVEARAGGAAIGSLSGQVGPVGETSDNPECMIWDIKDSCNAGGTNLELHLVWGAPTQMSINGLGTLLADELMIYPEMAAGDPDRPIIIGRVYNYSATGSNISPLVIGDEVLVPLPPCPGDCGDGDGVVGIVDFLQLLAEWNQVGTPCDLGAGVPGVGIEDFLNLLAGWGPCPIESP